jgi:D-beta-D-heptose 7-phosphate kinase/D-beta-D-heptose 1-phosphate adenosyltransferase
VIDVLKEEVTLGGAGNVIQNLCAFGLKPDVLSVTGDDEAAAEILGLLDKDRVPTSAILREPGRLTSKKTRVIAANHHIVRVDRETKTPVSAKAEDFMISYVEQHIQEYNLVLLSDYLKGVLTERVLAAVISLCKASGIPVIVDPKGADFTKYRGATYIKPNKKEAGIAASIPIKDRASLLAAAEKLKALLNCDSVVITLSEEGMAIYKDGLRVIPTKAREVFDVTGAGDTVLASLGICLAAGLSMEDACTFANHAAAIVVSRVGSATCTVEEVEQHMAEQGV